jgi:periplasmic protein CpxP/Spy
MRRLKHTLLLLALLVPASLLAQGGPGGGMGHGGRHMPSVDDQLSDLSSKLKLTDAQKPQVRAILQDQQDQMKQVMENSSGSREDNRAKMHEIHQASSAKIRDLLTDDQKAKYDKMQAERQKHWQGREGGNGSAPPPQQ